MIAWVGTAIAALSAAIDNIPMGTKVCSTYLLSAGQLKLLQVDSPAAKTQMKFFRENFVITYMDNARKT
jgi:hypothetical protein